MENKFQYKILFKFVNLLTHPLVNIFILIAWFLFSVTIQIIIFLAFNMQCSRSYVVHNILNLSFIILICLIWVLLFLYQIIINIKDLIVNGKKEKENCCKNMFYYFKRDPLFYKFETYFLIPVVIIIFIVAVNIGSLDVFNINIIMNGVLYHSMLFLQVLFPLLMTMYRWIIYKFYSVPPEGSLKKCLDDVLIKNTFKSFAKSEWSIENVLIYEDICLYEKNPNLNQANFIYENYLKTGSPLEVNVSKKEIEEILSSIKSEKLSKILFENIKISVLTNLKDTFSRFIYTNEYIIWETKNKLIEN